MLSQHLKRGNIRRIARGVFASVPQHADAKTWPVDRFLAASRLRLGGVIAYHSALELHGCAYTEGYGVQVIAQGEPGIFEAVGFTCRFVGPPHRLPQQGDALVNGVTTADRLGMEVSVTTLERTIVDTFDRYDLAGGSEELFNSLDLIVRIDVAALIRFVRSLGNATAAGALGYWLEHEQDRLGIPDSALKEIRKLMPSQAQYALGTRPGEGKIAKGWNVILPIDIIKRRFEGS